MHALEVETLGPRERQALFRPIGVEIAGHDARAMACEHQGAPAADPAADSGDDGHLALEPRREPCRSVHKGTRMTRMTKAIPMIAKPRLRATASGALA